MAITMLLSTLAEYRVDDVTRLIMHAMDDRTLQAYLLTNKYNLSLSHDNLFWSVRIKQRRLSFLLGLRKYYQSVGHFYFQIRNDYCYIVRYTPDTNDYDTDDLLKSHVSSTLQGAINYYNTIDEPLEYEIAIIFRDQRKMGLIAIFTPEQLIQRDLKIDFSLYPRSNLQGFILNVNNLVIVSINDDVIDFMIDNRQEQHYEICLAWIDHKPNFAKIDPEMVPLYNYMNGVNSVKQLCWYQDANFAGLVNYKGETFTPDLLLIVLIGNQYKIAFITEQHVKLLGKAIDKRLKRLKRLKLPKS